MSTLSVGRLVDGLSVSPVRGARVTRVARDRHVRLRSASRDRHTDVDHGSLRSPEPANGRCDEHCLTSYCSRHIVPRLADQVRVDTSTLEDVWTVARDLYIIASYQVVCLVTIHWHYRKKKTLKKRCRPGSSSDRARGSSTRGRNRKTGPRGGRHAGGSIQRCGGTHQRPRRLRRALSNLRQGLAACDAKSRRYRLVHRTQPASHNSLGYIATLDRRATACCSDRCGHYRAASSGVLLGASAPPSLQGGPGMSTTNVPKNYS
jgi:hypothetical protein